MLQASRLQCPRFLGSELRGLQVHMLLAPRLRGSQPLRFRGSKLPCSSLKVPASQGQRLPGYRVRGFQVPGSQSPKFPGSHSAGSRLRLPGTHSAGSRLRLPCFWCCGIVGPPGNGPLGPFVKWRPCIGSVHVQIS